jgi:hypothetical protein
MGRASLGGGGPSKHGWERNPQHPHPGTKILDKKHKRKAAMKNSKRASFVGGSVGHKPGSNSRRKAMGKVRPNEIERNAYETAARNVATRRFHEGPSF